MLAYYAASYCATADWKSRYTFDEPFLALNCLATLRLIMTTAAATFCPDYEYEPYVGIEVGESWLAIILLIEHTL